MTNMVGSDASGHKLPPVLFNASCLLNALTGVGYYTRELIRALNAAGQPTRQFYLWTWSDRLAEGGAAPAASAGRVPVSLRPLLRPLLRVAGGAAFAWRRPQPGAIYHEPNFVPYPWHDGPRIVTVHDLAWLRYPATLPNDRLRYLVRRMPAALAGADRIITVSDFTRKELCHYFPECASKVYVTPLGVDHQRFHPLGEQEEASPLESLASGEYVLAVGTLEPRKNLETLLEAYALLPADVARRYPLVVVGQPGWKNAQLKTRLSRLIEQGMVRATGYLPASVLPQLYRHAAAFVMPSRYEGFGLPVLEAMASACPVLLADAASLPEVAGDAALRFHPDDAVELACQLQTVLADQALRANLAAHGVSRAAGFTWGATAQKTLDVYHSLP